MAEERDRKAGEIEDPAFESDDVEAHKKAAQNMDSTLDEGDDDVEAHTKTGRQG